MKKIFLGLLSTSFLGLTACTTFSVEKERLAKVKTVAIVGFEVNQQIPPGLKDIFTAGRQKNDKSFGKVAGWTEAEHATEMYKNLATKLQKEKSWQVIPLEQMVANPAYIQAFKSKTEGLQNRPITDERTEMFHAKGVLDSFAIRTLDDEILQKLKQDLKVDAIVTASLTVHLNNNSALASLVGAGEYKPSATMYFDVKDLKDNKSIWMDTNAKGEEVKEGSRNFLGLTEESKLNKLVIEASNSAYNQLFENYKNAKSK